MILDFFDKAYLINLDKRKDRLEESSSILAGVGIPFERFPAVSLGTEPFHSPLHNIQITHHHGLYACGMSHHAALSKAGKEGLSSVLLMEDDLILCEGFVEKAKRCLSDLKGKNWDMFYFYNSYASDKRLGFLPVSDHVAKLPNAAWRTHFYAVNGPAIPKVVQMINQYGAQFDKGQFWWNAIDDIYAAFSATCGIETYGSIEILASQRGDEGTGTKGDSDIYVPTK